MWNTIESQVGLHIDSSPVGMYRHSRPHLMQVVEVDVRVDDALCLGRSSHYCAPRIDNDCSDEQKKKKKAAITITAIPELP